MRFAGTLPQLEPALRIGNHRVRLASLLHLLLFLDRKPEYRSYTAKPEPTAQI